MKAEKKEPNNHNSTDPASALGPRPSHQGRAADNLQEEGDCELPLAGSRHIRQAQWALQSPQRRRVWDTLPMSWPWNSLVLGANALGCTYTVPATALRDNSTRTEPHGGEHGCLEAFLYYGKDEGK